MGSLVVNGMYFVKFVLCGVVNRTSLFISGACSQVDVVLMENPFSKCRTLNVFAIHCTVIRLAHIELVSDQTLYLCRYE
jgi:hypothetical protein